MIDALREALQRAESWRDEAQQELAAIILDMDASLHERTYGPTAEEMAALETGLAAARAGEFATQAEVEAVFTRYRPA